MHTFSVTVPQTTIPKKGNPRGEGRVCHKGRLGREWGETGDTGGGKCALVKGLVLKHCIAETQPQTTLYHCISQ